MSLNADLQYMWPTHATTPGQQFLMRGPERQIKHRALAKNDSDILSITIGEFWGCSM